ncbi:FAD-binding oxidoreductase [Jiangella sp. DSM 45060]|uniref:FAD-binding oxidoreductase n=1 Tax=Jiangella sp. DSM 45060 TaxID=1798224 RepID=UPI00087A6EE5|nr:FAD-binding oxidoreductase [Jiangella sp. DSM 45060]SDT68106.1 FAD/FMN-containing dehydrogenase [Jiangella sp. DSM 45060]
MNTTPRPAVADLARRIDGPVLLPGQDRYDDERSGFNLTVDHRPDVVVGATSADDVAAAVRFAAERGLPVVAQATGHGAVVPLDGGLLISTRRLDGVHVDRDARVARIDAGVRWHQVIEPAADAGLAPLNGSSPLVGAVSYTLGGGLPVLGRTFGWAADRIRRLEVVTADGALVAVGPDENADLFWALRGGKGGFGVVTALEIELVALPRLYGGALVFGADRAADVVHAWRDWVTRLPDELNSSVGLVRLPDMPGVPEPLRGRLTVHVRVAYAGPADEGEELVRPLRGAGPRILDTVAALPPAGIAAVYNDPTEPIGYDERSLMLGSFDAAAADALLAAAGPDASADGLIMVDVRQLGGALARPPRHPRALDHDDAAFSVAAVGVGPAAGAAVLAALAPRGTGLRFLNFTGGPAAAGLAPEAFRAPTLDRLAAIKRDRDPGGVFPAPHLTGS